jgi:hypothetical protein
MDLAHAQPVNALDFDGGSAACSVRRSWRPDPSELAQANAIMPRFRRNPAGHWMDNLLPSSKLASRIVYLVRHQPAAQSPSGPKFGNDRP